MGRGFLPFRAWQQPGLGALDGGRLGSTLVLTDAGARDVVS